MHIIWELLLGREPREAEGSLFVCTCYPFNLISEYGGMRQELGLKRTIFRLFLLFDDLLSSISVEKGNKRGH